MARLFGPSGHSNKAGGITRSTGLALAWTALMLLLLHGLIHPLSDHVEEPNRISVNRCHCCCSHTDDHTVPEEPEPSDPPQPKPPNHQHFCPLCDALNGSSPAFSCHELLLVWDQPCLVVHTDNDWCPLPTDRDCHSSRAPPVCFV